MMEKVRLGEVCKIQGGYAFKSNQFQKNNIPIIRIGNIQENKVLIDNDICYTKEFLNSHPEFEIKDGDLLIAMSGATVGKVGIYSSKERALLNQRVGKFVITDKIESKYLYFLLLSPLFEKFILNNAFGCAQPNISNKQIEEFKFYKYSIEKQIEIANKLDKVQEIIDFRKKKIEELDELIKSQFAEMFGNPILNEKNWKVKKFKDLSNKIMSGNTPKGGEKNYVKNGIAFYRSQNVWKNKLELDDIVYIDEETHNRMKKSSLKHNDLLITKTGRINTENSSLGRTARYEGEDDKANINGHVYLVRLNKDVNNEFILRILISDAYREHIRSVCVGGIDKRQLNKEHIENFPIIYPPAVLQNKFVEFVKKIEKQKFITEKSLEETEKLRESLMNKYFG